MNIPVFIYIILTPLISPSVSMRFNKSLSKGIFPERFETAKIINKIKSAELNFTVNYIPISMQSLLSKLFVKMMYTGLDLPEIGQYLMYKSASVKIKMDPMK